MNPIVALGLLFLLASGGKKKSEQEPSPTPEPQPGPWVEPPIVPPAPERFSTTTD